MSKNKQRLGQFFTTNYKYVLQGLSIPATIHHIIEPFCGNGDLLNFISAQDQYTIEQYDIDPTGVSIIQRDTIQNPPVYTNKFVITNPPYLARNKSAAKTLYDKYDTNDLYKCFIKELILQGCAGGILIIPLNFWSSIRKADVDLRKQFLHRFRVVQLNIFEERVFEDTSYTVCSFQFEPMDPTTSPSHILTTIYPFNKRIETVLSETNQYMIGGEIYKLSLRNQYKISRLTSKTAGISHTNILVKCIDDNAENQISLSIVSDDEIYIDNTPNLSARTYATLVIQPVLSHNQQKQLVEDFNEFLSIKRNQYNSLFLTNYRESKDIARKRISFDLVYQIVEYILDGNDIRA
jgi:hypothetical protein